MFTSFLSLCFFLQEGRHKTHASPLFSEIIIFTWHYFSVSENIIYYYTGLINSLEFRATKRELYFSLMTISSPNHRSYQRRIILNLQIISIMYIYGFMPYFLSTLNAADFLADKTKIGIVYRLNCFPTTRNLSKKDHPYS